MSGVFNDITGFEVAFSVEQGDGQPEGGKLLASRAGELRAEVRIEQETLLSCGGVGKGVSPDGSALFASVGGPAL